MARPRAAPAAKPVRQAPTKLVETVLGNPDVFPDEFKAWLPRYLAGNVNLKVQQIQLPSVEAVHYVGAANQPPFQNGWVNYSATAAQTGFWRDRGVVYIGGVVKDGTVGVPIFTLPLGYRPRWNAAFPVVSQSGPNPAFGTARVDSNGAVYADASGNNVNFSLAGILFRAYP